MWLRLLILLTLMPFSAAPSHRQPSPDCTVWAQDSNVNIRSGPGEFQIIGVLLAGNSLPAIGRDGDWIQVAYINPSGDLSDHAWIAASAVVEQGSGCLDLPSVNDLPATADLRRLMNTPVLPILSPSLDAIFQHGQALGNHPNVFTTIGDCNTDIAFFLHGFDLDLYDLGPYADLQPTVDFFAESFIHDSQTGQVGYSALSMLDPLWANPQMCNAAESPLDCEYRLTRPSVVIIMFGLNDMCCSTEEEFSTAVRQIIDVSLANGVIPVLTTFTWHHDRWWSTMLRYNVIVLDLAAEYDLPVVNFWRAAQSLPNYGLVQGYTHLTDSGFPVYEPWIVFAEQEQTSGYALRNLVTLQILDRLRADVLSPRGIQ
jgi:hypothetical protein